MTGPEAEAAARLLEGLLVDPALRRHFRRDPVGASREAGAESVAQEMSFAAGKAMETLDERESRSSLAGVFMAAALEGAGGFELVRDVVPHLEQVPESVGQVLSRVDLPAIPGLHVASAEAAPPDNAAGEFRAVLPELHTARGGDSVDPAQFGQEGTGGARAGRGRRAAPQQARHARLRRHRRPEVREDRPALGLGADRDHTGSRDQRVGHDVGPRQEDERRLGIQSLPRARPRHRHHRRPAGRPRQPGRARGGNRALPARSEHPPKRDRIAVGIAGTGVLHRRGPPEPPPHRLRRSDCPAVDAPGESRGGWHVAGLPGRPVAGFP